MGYEVMKTRQQGATLRQKRYLVIPGVMFSQDGDRHYVSARQLMTLYNVPLKECLAICRPEEWQGLRFEHLAPLIALTPTVGEYDVSKCAIWLRLGARIREDIWSLHVGPERARYAPPDAVGAGLKDLCHEGC